MTMFSDWMGALFGNEGTNPNYDSSGQGAFYKYNAQLNPTVPQTVSGGGSVVGGPQDMGSGSEELLAGAPLMTGNRPEMQNITESKSSTPRQSGSKAAPLLPVPQVDAGVTGKVDAQVNVAPITKTAAKFGLTPAQTKALEPLYGKNEDNMRSHVLYKIASGDQSLGPYTAEQVNAHRTNVAQRSSGFSSGSNQVSAFQSLLSTALKLKAA